MSDPSHDADGLGGEEPRVSNLVVHDAVKDLFLIVTREWRLQHKNTTQQPDCKLGLPR